MLLAAAVVDPNDIWVTGAPRYDRWLDMKPSPDSTKTHLSLITFNDTHPVADLIPPLTTVALPGREMAVRAVEMLLRQLEEPQRRPETVVLDETLIVRESTAPPISAQSGEQRREKP